MGNIKTITVDGTTHNINDARISAIPLPISEGGTSATTAAAARTALGITDTKVTQTDITGNTDSNYTNSILLSSDVASTGTTTSTANRSQNLLYNESVGAVAIKAPSNALNVGKFQIQGYNGGVYAVLRRNTEGTSSTVGIGELQLGRNVAEGNENNAIGRISVYGYGTGANWIYPGNTTSTSYTNTIPAVTGYFAVGATSGVGSSSTPIYMDANGELQACSGVAGSDTKVTKENSSSGWHLLLADNRNGNSATTTEDGTAVFDPMIGINAEKHYISTGGRADTMGNAAGFKVYDTTNSNLVASMYHRTQGTASTVGWAYVALGNSIASGTDNNCRGGIGIYGTGTGSHIFLSGATSTTSYTSVLPPSSGYLVTNGNHSSLAAIGSSTKGVYMDANGVLQECSYTLGQNVSSSAKLTDTYPSGLTWTGGTTAGPVPNISRAGSTTTAATGSAIPSASASASGIVTTGAQTFAGNKTFSGVLTANSKLIGKSGAVSAGNYTTTVPTAAGTTGQIMFVLQ